MSHHYIPENHNLGYPPPQHNLGGYTQPQSNHNPYNTGGGFVPIAQHYNNNNNYHNPTIPQQQVVKCTMQINIPNIHYITSRHHTFREFHWKPFYS